MILKSLITGGSGMIGYKVLDFFLNNNKDVEFTFFKNNVPLKNGHYLDITKKEDTIKLITKINPDFIIHTAALANVDLCETNHILADSINVKGTENIIEACKITKSMIVYVSTSFVFDGKQKQYFEEDAPSPETYYGLTKNKAENIVKNSGLDYLILRTDQPYCWVEKWQRTNSVIRAVQTLSSSKILRDITDWYNNPTYVPNFVDATIKLIDNKETGIFHLVGSDFINRFNWSCMVADIFGLDKNMIKPITSDTLNLPAKRGNVNLNNQKIFKKTAIRMMGIKEGLKNMKKKSKII